MTTTTTVPSFTAGGRTWQVRIGIPALRRLRDAHGVLLVGDQLAAIVERAHVDPVLVVDLLHAILQPADITKPQFEALFDEHAIEPATVALLEALVCAIPHAADRERVRAAVADYRRALQQLREIEVAPPAPPGAVAELVDDIAARVVDVTAERERANSIDVVASLPPEVPATPLAEAR